MNAPHDSPLTPSPEDLHARFLSLVPGIQLHAAISFRHVRCPHHKEDLIAEVVSVSWAWFVSLARKGKDARAFPMALATLAVRHVRSGRRLCGQEPARDVLSPTAQARHGFVVGKLPDFETLSNSPLMEALVENRRTPPDEQAAFRCDFPCWLAGLGQRNRQVAEAMALGERTQDLARTFGLSPGRISQLRREFLVDWERFCADPGDGTSPTVRV